MYDRNSGMNAGMAGVGSAIQGAKTAREETITESSLRKTRQAIEFVNMCMGEMGRLVPDPNDGMNKQETSPPRPPGLLAEVSANQDELICMLQRLHAVLCLL